MEREIYRRMREIEHRHWWFRGRRRILAAVLGRLGLPPGAAILDAGCGTGGNLELLGRLGRVTGLESDAEARQVAAERNFAPVLAGSLPDDVPLADATFDLVTLLDVLEHIDDDAGALRAAARLLRPAGFLVLTVPAYACLWSRHDEVHHHKRRYTRGALRERVACTGLTVRHATYFNSWLLPLVALARGLERLRRPAPAEQLPLPPPAVNAILEHVFASERLWVARRSLPAGVSILLVAQKGAA
jgi:SAM-dependent methyltransferase